MNFLKIVILMLVMFFGVGTTFNFGAVAYGQDNLAGTVLETMNSGGYSYALIEKDNVKKWVAIPQAEIFVGDEVEFYSGVEMGQYSSKTLNRTFDNIIFSSGIVALVKAGQMPKAKDEVEETVEVEKAAGENAYSIAELYEQRKALAGQKVVVRGKVFKVSKFMGATWVRIKDGSGSRKKGNNKLVVITSQEDAVEGDVLTASGVLVVDKNVAGLSYEVVVEQGILTK